MLSGPQTEPLPKTPTRTFYGTWVASVFEYRDDAGNEHTLAKEDPDEVLRIVMSNPPPSPVQQDGITAYHNGTTIHREDGPAVIWQGGECYYLNGMPMYRDEVMGTDA